jgi:hypothetical protein
MPARLWKPDIRDALTDSTTAAVSALGGLAGVVALLSGASVEAVVSVSFGALTVLVVLDMVAGIVRTVVLDYRAWLLEDYTGQATYKSTLHWRKAIHTPIKWVAYGVATLAGAMVLVSLTQVNLEVPGVWAIAAMHLVLCLVEAASIAANLSVFPGIAQGFAGLLRKIHSPAAEKFAESVEQAHRIVTEEELQERERLRRGNAPRGAHNLPRINGTDN